MPESDALLPWLLDQGTDALLAILAPMVARGVTTGESDWTTGRGAREPAAQVARIAGLDMRNWWKPTVADYLGRVSKALILDAVREGVGPTEAHRIEDMKKAPMAEAAAGMLAGTGWLPPMLRLPADPAPEAAAEPGEGEGQGYAEAAD